MISRPPQWPGPSNPLSPAPAAAPISCTTGRWSSASSRRSAGPLSALLDYFIRNHEGRSTVDMAVCRGEAAELLAVPSAGYTIPAEHLSVLLQQAGAAGVRRAHRSAGRGAEHQRHVRHGDAHRAGGQNGRGTGHGHGRHGGYSAGGNTPGSSTRRRPGACSSGAGICRPAPIRCPFRGRRRIRRG